MKKLIKSYIELTKEVYSEKWTNPAPVFYTIIHILIIAMIIILFTGFRG